MKDIDKLIEDKAEEGNRVWYGTDHKIVGTSYYVGFKDCAKFALTPEVLREVPEIKALIDALRKSECDYHFHHEPCGTEDDACQTYKALAPFKGIK